jgi:hypothetical protein
MLRNIHWHPLLLALYPLLHLLAQNTASVRPRAALLFLALAAGAVLVLWGLSSLLLRDRGKGALLSALTAVLFFGHDHLLGLIGGGTTAAWILIGSGSLAVLAAGIFLTRWTGNPRPWNRIMDAVAITLSILVLVPIVMAELRPSTYLPTDERYADLQTPLGYLPDIYVIVMDAFGRADKLKEIYGVDLSELQDHLEQNGFQIARQADANYCQTSPSLGSFFNSTYLPELLPGFEPGHGEMSLLNGFVRENRAVRRLRELGYQLVTFAGGSELAVQADPDVNYRGGALNEFQTMVWP